MKLVYLLLLLSVFAVAGCTERGVTLTSSEQGNLKLATIPEGDLDRLGMTEHPGYMDPEAVEWGFPDGLILSLKSVYLAAYVTDESPSREYNVITLVFSDTVDAILEDFTSFLMQQDAEFRLLHKEKTIVIVVTEESDSTLIDIVDKLSRRLGMVVVHTEEPEVVFTEEPGVVLTLSEKGALDIANLTEVELLSLGMDENPGYGAAEKLPEFPLAQTVYAAFYELRPGGDHLVIVTVTFNSPGDLDADLEEIKSASVDGDWVLLRDGNVLVVVEHAEDSELVAGIADKLSRRLGMVVVYPEESEVVNNYI